MLVTTILEKYLNNHHVLLDEINENYDALTKWDVIEMINSYLKDQFLDFDEDYKISKHIYRHLKGAF